MVSHGIVCLGPKWSANICQVCWGCVELQSQGAKCTWKAFFFSFLKYRALSKRSGGELVTVVWNDYLLIFWPNVIFYYTRSWKPNANNQICWITKVSTHSKTLIQFCWKFIYFKDVYWWFLKIWICDKMRALFIFQIIDYAWISIMLFDLCWKW